MSHLSYPLIRIPITLICFFFLIHYIHSFITFTFRFLFSNALSWHSSETKAFRTIHHKSNVCVCQVIIIKLKLLRSMMSDNFRTKMHCLLIYLDIEFMIRKSSYSVHILRALSSTQIPFESKRVLGIRTIC